MVLPAEHKHRAQVSRPISLRARCTVSGTDIAYTRYAVSSTSCSLWWYQLLLKRVVLNEGMVVPAATDVCGTERGYG
eukprot:836862-Rhodomonas_salina.1